jgi:hypothetical protein
MSQWLYIDKGDLELTEAAMSARACSSAAMGSSCASADEFTPLGSVVRIASLVMG